MSEVKNQQFLLGLFGGISVVSVIGLIILGIAFVSGGKNANPTVAGQQTQPQQQQNTQVIPKQLARVSGVISFYEKADAQICKENGKPVVYLFSTTWCPHCKWISKTFDETVKKYVDEGKIVAYHWEVDTNDNTLTDAKETAVPAEHLAIYQEFNPQGSIPTFVFGCKYYRVGNGFEQADDLDSEVKEFEALIAEISK